MPTQANPVPPIPREVARSARAAFGSSDFYLLLGDRLAALLGELRLETLMAEEPSNGSVVPLRAMVTYFQLVEGLSDLQATEAIRSRIDWKYALHLPLNPPVPRPRSLCDYRQALLIDPVAMREFRALVRRLGSLGHSRGDSPLAHDNGKMLASLCAFNRLQWNYEAMHRLLEALASAWPQWLRSVALPHWYTFYRAASPPIVARARGEEALALSRSIGADALHLLGAIANSGDPALSELQEVRALQQVWRQQFERCEGGQIALRAHCSFCSAGP